MFVPFCIVSFVCFSPEMELRVRLEQRYTALSAISAVYQHSIYVSPRNAPPLDASSWNLVREPLSFHITISRPNVLVRLLDERPDLGFTAVDYHICDDRYMARWVQPDREGRQIIERSENSTQHGLFTWSLALEAFELRFSTRPERYESLLTLLDAGRLEVLGTDGERFACRFTDRLDDGAACEHFCEIDQFGLATQTTTLIYPADPALTPITMTCVVLASRDFCGVSVPDDIAMIVDNPNVASAPGRTVQRIALSSIELADGPEIAKICDEPILCNANVTEYQSDGTRVRRIYDTDGQVIQTDRIGAFAAGSGRSDERKLAWTWLAFPTAAGFIMIGFVAWAVGRTTRP